MNISICNGVSTKIMEYYHNLKYLTGADNVFRYDENSYLSSNLDLLSKYKKIIFVYNYLNMNLTLLPDNFEYLRLSFTVPLNLEKCYLNNKSIKMLKLEDDIDGNLLNDKNIINMNSKYLPKNIEFLDLFETYITNLDDFVVPETVKVFILPKQFNGDLDKIKWNKSIEIILFGDLMNKSIDCLSNLDSLKCIGLGNYYNQKINILPKNLELLRISFEYYDHFLEHIDKDNLNITCYLKKYTNKINWILNYRILFGQKYFYQTYLSLAQYKGLN